MCGTFAILSPDLFTYVYSRIPPGSGNVNLFRNAAVGERCALVGGWVGGRRRERQRKGGCVGGWLVQKVCEGFDGWMVLVTSRKQPKAAFAPFLKFFTIFDAPPTDCAVRVKGHVSDRGKRQFFPPPPSPSARPLSFFTKSRSVQLQASRVYPYIR